MLKYRIMNVSDEKYELIISYILGELSDDEVKALELWINECSENKSIYEEILKDYMFVRFSHKDKLIDKDKSYTAISELLIKPRRTLFYYSVAASIIVMFAIGSLLVINNKSVDTVVDKVADTKILPGEQKAVLFLSSGEKLNVSDNNTSLKESDGTSVVIDSLKGVSYERKGNVLDKKLIYNKIVVPRGGEYSATLSDGTKVWLNAESELRFPVDFIGDKRVVYLKGEGYFQVAHDKNKPFILSINDFRLKVFGTEFNVNAYKKDIVETVLVNGSVGLHKVGADKQQMLKPGELGALDMESGHVTVSEVDVNQYIAWKNGDFVFVNEDLESIMTKLGRWYDLEVFYQNSECKELRFSGDMKRYDDIKDFLFFIEKSSDIKFRIKGRSVIIGKKL